jgi:4-amino-4-deoxy-L-arabinose transferase-like glycosyltransferase
MQKYLQALNRHKVMLIILISIILLKVIIIREIGNRDWEPDGYNHVLYVNSVFSNIPSSLKLGIEVWAKPLYTYIFGLISLIIGGRSLFNVQILNVFIWSISSFIIYLIANLLGGRRNISIFIGFLTSITFIVFRDSMTSLTEPVFTLFLVLNIYFLMKSKYLLSTLCISLLPLGRMEGFIFLCIYFLFILYIFIFKNEFGTKKLFLYGVICLKGQLRLMGL